MKKLSIVLVLALILSVVSPDSVFAANVPKTVTRKDLAVMLYEAYGGKLTTTKADVTWSDISQSASYQKAVDWMKANKLISGTVSADGKTYAFSPDAQTDRKYVALAVYRLGKALGATWPVNKDATSTTDMKELADGYVTAINTLRKAKVMSDYTDGTFRPDSKVSETQLGNILKALATIKGMEAKAPVQAAAIPPSADVVNENNYPDIEYAVSILGPYSEALGYIFDSYPENSSKYYMWFGKPNSTAFVSMSHTTGNGYWHCQAFADGVWGYGRPESTNLYSIDEMKAVLDEYIK